MSILEEQLRLLVREIVRSEIRGAIDEARGDEFLSTRDAAKLASVAEGTIRRWIREGQLNGHRAGRVMRILRTDLQALLRKGPSQPSNDSPEAMARRELG